jgi:hypothetical protein
MAEAVLLKNADVWLGGTDLSGSLNSIQLAAAKAEKPNGRFGDAGEVFFPGLQQISADLAGFFAAGSGEPDPAIWGRIDPTVTPASWPLTINPPYAPAAAPGADGNNGYTVVGHQFNYRTLGQHGELIPYSLGTRLGSTYQLCRHTVIAPRATVTATTTGTATNLGALAAATDRLLVALHVFSITGGTWTLTIESDALVGFGSPIVQATFTAVTAAPARQVVLIPGPITDGFWRAVMTKSGGTNLNYAVVAGIVSQ